MTLRNDLKGDLRVTDIAPGGPAAQCQQLRRGDIIAVIAGRNVRGMSVMQARDLIMGPQGSIVTLGVHREARGPQVLPL
jgi:C-terminal processing protease CtpA/Prc